MLTYDLITPPYLDLGAATIHARVRHGRHATYAPHRYDRLFSRRTKASFVWNGTMDIDDLLAEVAVDSTPRETRDLQELTRCWVAERVAPEILPWPEELMERVLERIRRQVSARKTAACATRGS